MFQNILKTLGIGQIPAIFPINIGLGSRGDDSLSGSSRSDLILALNGDDTISASLGDDTVHGGSGFDTVIFEGSIRDVELDFSGLAKGKAFHGLKASTAIVTQFDATGAAAGVTRTHGVEALTFAADGYTLYLDGRNNAVLAGDDVVTTDENTALQLTAEALLANDTDFDGDGVAIVSVDATSALGAAVSFADGQITYTPAAAFDALAEGETLEDSFTYTVDDGFGGSDTATVTVTVTGANDAPVISASDAAVAVAENTRDVAAGISASDVDGGAQLAFSLEGPDAALFVIDAETGAIHFAADPDFEAPADANGDNTYALTVVVTDEFGAQDSTQISVAVGDVWDPIALTQSFETEAGGARYSFAGADGSLVALGAEVELPNVTGAATVDSTDASAGLLGFDLSWVNTRNDTGIADGDFIGVTSYTNDVGTFSDGAQGYELQDADGLLRLTFDTVDLSARQAATVVRVSLDAFITETGWESDDLVRIYIETNLGTVTLLDSSGSDIDDLGIEGSWHSLGATLSQEVTEATLVVELDSNAAAENLYIDNVAVSELFQLTQSFETEATGGKYGFAGAADGPVAPGGEVDVPNIAGLASVDSTEASAGQLGYDLSWVNTRGDVGLSDADFIGVQSYTGTVGSFTDGAQGYELSDSDGLLRMSFDQIDLSDVGAVTVSLDAFLQQTGWEADDLVNIYVETDLGIVSLLDTTGSDIDDLGIEGSWQRLSATLGADVSSARLVVDFDSNSAEEALFIDAVKMTADPAAADGEGGGETEITLISAVQGAGAASGKLGEMVSLSALVTLVTSDGFYLQEEEADSDGNALTSEGIFVYTGGGYAVTLGDLVEVTGSVTEFLGLTEITSVSSVEILGSGYALPAATVLALSPDETPNYEALEGMRLSVTTGTSEALTVIENFNLDRYGQITVSAGTQTQPTQLYDAQTEAAEIAALAAANANARLLLDDGVSTQNPDSYGNLPGGTGDDGNGVLDRGDDFSDAGTTVRLGAEVDGPVEGVLTYAFGEWTLNVAETLTLVEATNSGARSASPEEVGGSLQVASYNVLNFFTTLTGGTGPDGTLEPRGADDDAEFARQASKLVQGIIGTGAEVLALQEIENNGTTAIGTLVDLLNDEGTGASYAYVDPTGTGDFIGSDAITTGIIYDAAEVTVLYSDALVYDEASSAATYAIASELAGSIGRSFDDLQRNRPSVAATFRDNDSGETFTIVSSHFKSKGDSGLQSLADAAESWLSANAGAANHAAVSDLLSQLYADANFDQGDGQGFWNGVRLDAAMELADWISTEYGGGGASNYLLLGDMNSYAEEDAVQYLDDDAGLTDLIDTFIGQDTAYSYVFDGMQGTLDQGLADSALAARVTGVTEWHINADEPDLINYDTTFKDPAFYNDGVYASSDHDPLIVGLDFTGADEFLLTA
ncbi:ExeM/NucH family extracellular endonuclease [Salipiger mangrovisoli]|uniref:ExeM/NucH family extracellular endonuclease n=1 Tax=Salipiger mangrovisoli TaxID=2865933 RepID=A0ABR9X547_9RHOB|nr:ExeM/NucH family extracellular endonuclease [Salipiger mangrovisoli]MBE9638728.1 ExeM/NucH family extracellular endonuclease [Salipiger mangrovisoli]